MPILDETRSCSCGRPTRRRAAVAAPQVSVELQLNSIYNLVEKGQSFQSDFILISTWFDPRLVNPKAPEVTVYGTDVFDKGLLWSPKLTFANRRDLTNSIEGVVRVTRAGQVPGAFFVHFSFSSFKSLHHRLRKVFNGIQANAAAGGDPGGAGDGCAAVSGNVCCEPGHA